MQQLCKLSEDGTLFYSEVYQELWSLKIMSPVAMPFMDF